MKKTAFILTIVITAAVVYAASLYSFGSCGLYEVPCYKWNESSQKYDCDCQLFTCKPGYKQGVCPNP